MLSYLPWNTLKSVKAGAVSQFNPLPQSHHLVYCRLNKCWIGVIKVGRERARKRQTEAKTEKLGHHYFTCMESETRKIDQ